MSRTTTNRPERGDDGPSAVDKAEIGAQFTYPLMHDEVLPIVGSTPKRTAVVHVGGQRLRVSMVSEGAGRPLLLINGIGATGDLFDDFRVHVTDRETIAFDAPGVGGSPAPVYPRRVKWFARMIAGMLTELGHDRVDVLGISWGGALAQEFARRHPDRVRRLVLVATTPGVISLPGSPRALAVLMTPARYYSPDYLKAVAPTLYGGSIREHPEMLARHGQARATRPPTPVGYLWQLSAMRRWTSLPYLRRMTMPTLVMGGDDDPIIPLVNARMITSRMPNAKLHVVKGGGHLFLFTRAEEMAAHIREFLEEP